MSRQQMPKVIWTLWLQGWDNAPEIARACLTSWRRLNPDWKINALDQHTLEALLPPIAPLSNFPKTTELEALSDIVRIELLSRYGGVWADATAMCARPLDEWLPSRMATGFFAFDRPGPDRMLASWFLAAAPDNYIIERWKNRVSEYWSGRASRDHYFWFHKLFASQHESDSRFRALWNETPALPAKHAFHFSPDDKRLIQRATPDYVEALHAPPSPVFKLTHKLHPPLEDGSLLEVLSRFARGEAIS